MAEDMTLSAGIELEDQSAIEDLTADIGATEGDGGSQGGGGGGLGGIMDILGNMTGLLKVATVALGLIAAIPGLLKGVMRLLEIALLPIGVLFQSLLAPLLQRLLRFLVENDILGKVQRFASQIVDSIQNFIAGLDPLIQALNDFLDTGQNTVEKASEDPVFTGGAAVSGVPGVSQFGQLSQLNTLIEKLDEENRGITGVGGDFISSILNPDAEFSSSSRDEYAGESAPRQTQEATS